MNLYSFIISFIRGFGVLGFWGFGFRAAKGFGVGV
jgi:hypothetical protein